MNLLLLRQNLHLQAFLENRQAAFCPPHQIVLATMQVNLTLK